MLQEDSKFNKFLKINNIEDENLVFDIIALLPKKNKFVFECTYGLNGHLIKPSKEIALALGLSAGYVRALNTNSKRIILAKLKEKEQSNGKKDDFAEFVKNTSLELLNEAVSSLNNRFQEVYKYYYVDKLNKDEIVLKTNLKVSTIDRYLSSIKKQVKTYINEHAAQDIIIKEEDKEEKGIPVKNKERTIKNVNEICALIRSNYEYLLNTKYICNGQSVYVSKSINLCSIVDLDDTIKRYIVYKFRTYKNDGIIDEKISLQDPESKKIYGFAHEIRTNSFNVDGEENKVYYYSVTKKYITEEQKNAGEKTEEDILNIYGTAKYLFEQKKDDEAMSTMNILLTMDIKNKDILYNLYYMLGILHSRHGRLVLTEKYLKMALEVNRHYACFLRLGKNYYTMGQYSKALEAYDECDKLNAVAIPHKNEKALVYHKLRVDDTAIKILDDIIWRTDNIYAYMYKIDILIDNKKYRDCINIINVVKRKYPNNSYIVFKEAQIKFLMGKKKEAIELFDNLDTKDPQGESYLLSIGHFFHSLGEEELAYKYYCKDDCFNKKLKYTGEELNNHYIKHHEEDMLKSIHSVFNVKLSLNELTELISNISINKTKPMYDIYQIRWSNIGYMQQEGEKAEDLNYLTIYVLPFTKKVMMAYPDYKLVDAKEPLSIDEVRKINSESVDAPINDEEILYVDEEKEISNKKQDKNKDALKSIINTFNDAKVQVILLLAFGYVNDRMYSAKEISKVLDIKEDEVISTINSSLNEIKNLLISTTSSMEDIRKSLTIK